jgi:hypothetical protein
LSGIYRLHSRKLIPLDGCIIVARRAVSAARTVSGTGEAADLRFQFQFRVIPSPRAETEQSRAPRPYTRTNLISRRGHMEKQQDLREKILA